MYKAEVGFSEPQMGLKQGPERASMDMCGCARESAKSVLQRQIKYQQSAASAEEVLIKVIPWDLLSKQDEEVLYNWFSTAYRR